jgi:hypothetical protein
MNDRMIALAKMVRIEVERDNDGWHGIIVTKATGNRWRNPQPFPTDNGAILATRAIALANIER